MVLAKQWAITHLSRANKYIFKTRTLPLADVSRRFTTLFLLLIPLPLKSARPVPFFCHTSKMADAKTKFESLREWVVEHKLRTVGSLWLSGIAGSIAYNWSRPNMKTSVKIIHARLHAQAFTLAALAGAAVVEYYDHKTGAKADRYAKFLPVENFNSRKD